MKTAIKIIAGFVVGAAAGSLATYFIVRDKFQVIADEQIANMREYYIKHPPKERKTESQKKPEGKNSENNDPFDNRGKRNYEELAQRYVTRYTNPDLNDLMGRVHEEVDDEGNTISAEIPHEDIREEPYLIPEDSYMRRSTSIGFGSEALEYWVHDNVLTIADSDEVVDIKSTIGLEAIDALLDPGRDSDVVFVRNEKLSMEYEVERNDGSYAEWIGEDIPDEQPQQRRFRNKYEDDDD